MHVSGPRITALALDPYYMPSLGTVIPIQGWAMESAGCGKEQLWDLGTTLTPQNGMITLEPNDGSGISVMVVNILAGMSSYSGIVTLSGVHGPCESLLGCALSL